MAYVRSTSSVRAIGRAAATFERFHGRACDSVRRWRAARTIPRVLVDLGELRGLIYRSDKWGPPAACGGRARTFIHFMSSPARLASDPQGRRLFILSNSIRVTRRGIEG
jgi:hypothetical protein